MALNTKVWTRKVTSAILNIQESYGLTVVSIVLVSGAGTVKGSLSIGGLDSQPLALTTGVPITINAAGNAPLSEIIITETGGGEIQVIGR